MSQTFYDLRIPSHLVGNQLTAKSIMIGTLFLLLQEALACGGFNADQTLARLIKQDPEIAGAISVATTRIPDFGEQISNPSHGFRSLCCLGTVIPQPQDIPQTFHPSYELLASITQTDNPVANCFAISFQPMGIDLISHFNIIFYPFDVSSIPSLWKTSTSAESSLSPWDSISAVQSRNPSPPVDVTALFQSTCNPSQLCQPFQLHQSSSSSCDVASPHVSESSSPYGSANVVIPPSHLPAASPQPQPQPELQLQPLTLSVSPPFPLSLLSPRLQSLPSSLPPPVPLPPPLPPQSLSSPPITLRCSISNSAQDKAVGESSTLELQPSESGTSSSCSTIALLLKTYVTDEQKEAAIYRRNFKGLYLKVRNFNAMNSILERLGYSLPFHVTADPTVKLSDITVKASDVLHNFGWAPTSFEHKALWYGTAKILSQRDWKRGMPGK
jgi:hypothetical protein